MCISSFEDLLVLAKIPNLQKLQELDSTHTLVMTLKVHILILNDMRGKRRLCGSPGFAKLTGISVSPSSSEALPAR